MKKLITIAFLMVAIGAHAQLIKIKSKSALADSIWIPKGAREMQPIVVNTHGDTARSFTYSITFTRDTSGNVVLIPTVFDKAGTFLKNENLNMPASGYKKWGLLIVPLDAFIHNQFSRVTPL